MLTHKDLINLGETLGYTNINNGLCAGFTGMWMQAVLAKDETTFYDRLKLIEAWKDNFPDLVKQLDAVKETIRNCPENCRKKSGEIDYDQLFSNPREKEKAFNLLEILSFYDGIGLYLAPQKHLDLFSIPMISNQDMSTIFSIVHAEQLKNAMGEASLEKLLDKNAGFEKNELLHFIEDLETIFKSQRSQMPTTIHLTSYIHSVCLKYNFENSEKPWEYIDTNHLENSAFFRCCNSVELSDAIMQSLAWNGDYLVFNTLVISTQENAELKNKLNEVSMWHPIKSDNLARIDTTSKATLLHLSLNRSPTSAPKVREINELLKNMKPVDKSTLCKIKDVLDWNPLMLAAKFQAEAIFPLLTDLSDADKKEVLETTNKEGENALMIAVVTQPDAVPLLLDEINRLAPQDKQIILMEKNNAGNNALMIAIQQQPKAILPLLDEINRVAPQDKKIILTEKNNVGWNALMIAIQQQPKAVLPLLEAIRELKEPGAKKEIFMAEDTQGWNALQLAAYCNPSTIEPLLAEINNDSDKKAFLMHTTKDGYNVLQIAGQNPTTVFTLLNEMAKLDVNIDISPPNHLFLDNLYPQSVVDNLEPRALDILLNAMFLDKNQHSKLQSIIALIPIDEYSKLQLKTHYIMTFQKDCPLDKKRLFLKHLNKALKENEGDLPIKQTIQQSIRTNPLHTDYKKAALIDAYNALEEAMRQRFPTEKLNYHITLEWNKQLQDRTSRLYEAFNLPHSNQFLFFNSRTHLPKSDSSLMPLPGKNSDGS